jgi:hypothetical protein
MLAVVANLNKITKTISLTAPSFPFLTINIFNNHFYIHTSLIDGKDEMGIMCSKILDK